MSKEIVVIDKIIEESDHSIKYCVKFDTGEEWEYKELKRLKSAARIPRRKEFIKNANIGDKIKKEDFDDMKESNRSD